MLYFAYGSNLHLNQMLKRCPGAEPLTQAILHGYSLKYRRGVATVEKDKKGKVYGAVYNISDTDMEVLDIYEGYPYLYYRKPLKVEAKGIGEVKAITYMMHKQFQETGPRDGYYQVIEEGFRNWALPINHLRKSLIGGVKHEYEMC